MPRPLLLHHPVPPPVQLLHHPLSLLGGLLVLLLLVLLLAGPRQRPADALVAHRAALLLAGSVSLRAGVRLGLVCVLAGGVLLLDEGVLLCRGAAFCEGGGCNLLVLEAGIMMAFYIALLDNSLISTYIFTFPIVHSQFPRCLQLVVLRRYYHHPFSSFNQICTSAIRL